MAWFNTLYQSFQVNILNYLFESNAPKHCYLQHCHNHQTYCSAHFPDPRLCLYIRSFLSSFVGNTLKMYHFRNHTRNLTALAHSQNRPAQKQIWIVLLFSIEKVIQNEDYANTVFVAWIIRRIWLINIKFVTNLPFWAVQLCLLESHIQKAFSRPLKQVPSGVFQLQ